MTLCFYKHKKYSEQYSKLNCGQVGLGKLGRGTFTVLNIFVNLCLYYEHISHLQHRRTKHEQQTYQSWLWSTPPDFFLSRWKACFTFPPRTNFILKGVAIPLSLFFHLPQNPSCHPRCQEEQGRTEFSPHLPTPERVLATCCLLSCFLWQTQQLKLLSWTLISRKLKREETIEVTGFNFLTS